MTSSSDSVDPAPPWVELPREITATILHKLGTLDMLNAQAVCTTWWSLCEDPGLWRSIDMEFTEVELCCLAVDRSQGQLNDIKIRCFGTDEMLLYISQRSGGLRCLILESCYDITDEGVIEAVKNLPLLEELHFYYNLIRVETIETVGRTCLNLKSFKFNRCKYRPYIFRECDFEALAIARTMQELRHLEIRGSDLIYQLIPPLMTFASSTSTKSAFAEVVSVDLSGAGLTSDNDLNSNQLSLVQSQDVVVVNRKAKSVKLPPFIWGPEFESDFTEKERALFMS